MWLDADDVLDETNRQALKALKNSLTADVDMVMMPYVAAFDEEGKPTLSYERERIVRRTANFSWVGARCTKSSCRAETSCIRMFPSFTKKSDLPKRGAI